MFERFTKSARRAVVLAQEEARMLDQPQIGSEHVLIGLAGDGGDPAATALRGAGVTGQSLRTLLRRMDGDPLDPGALALLGIDLDQVRRAAEERFGRGALDATPGRHSPKGHIPFSGQAKKVLELAVRESMALGSGSISSGHLLLGIIRDGDAGGARLLKEAGVDLSRLREETVALVQSEAA
jgi:ATP-dependent Clp protease ATP-binding subunit ClpA